MFTRYGISVLILLTTYVVSSLTWGLKSESDDSPVVSPDSSLKAVDIMFQGKRVYVPYYDQDMLSVSDERKKLDVEIIEAMEKVFLRIIDDLYVKNRYTITVVTLNVPEIYRIVNYSKSRAKELHEAGLGYKAKTGFTKGFIGIFRQAIKSNNDTGKEKDKLKFLEKMRSWLMTFTECVRQSPVGANLDWKNLVKDGETMSEQLAYLVKYSKRNGINMKYINPMLDLFYKYW